MVLHGEQQHSNHNQGSFHNARNVPEYTGGVYNKHKDTKVEVEMMYCKKYLQ